MSDGESALLAYPRLLTQFLAGLELYPLLTGCDRLKHQIAWRDLVRALKTSPPSSMDLSQRFHTKWHEGHHFLRELVDDDDLLIDMLWIWLPRYSGGNLVLYRGENIDRFEAGRLGTAWSDLSETAELFASGLNAVGKGGIILRTSAPATAIIAGPTDHSAHWLRENEFTVDVRKLGNIETLERFAPIYQ